MPTLEQHRWNNSFVFARSAENGQACWASWIAWLAWLVGYTPFLGLPERVSCFALGYRRADLASGVSTTMLL